jgi:hypothetical protein
MFTTSVFPFCTFDVHEFIPILLACNNLPAVFVYDLYVWNDLQYGRLSCTWLIANDLATLLCYNSKLDNLLFLRSLFCKF